MRMKQSLLELMREDKRTKGILELRGKAKRSLLPRTQPSSTVT